MIKNKPVDWKEKGCSECEFYFEQDLECRKLPPILIYDIDAGVLTMSPNAKPKEWCGEWEQDRKKFIKQSSTEEYDN